MPLNADTLFGLYCGGKGDPASCGFTVSDRAKFWEGWQRLADYLSQHAALQVPGWEKEAELSALKAENVALRGKLNAASQAAPPQWVPGPTCTVCGATMVLKCLSCGSTPELSAAPTEDEMKRTKNIISRAQILDALRLSEHGELDEEADWFLFSNSETVELDELIPLLRETMATLEKRLLAAAETKVRAGDGKEAVSDEAPFSKSYKARYCECL